MLRRLFTLVVLLVLVAAGLIYFKLLPAGLLPKNLGLLGQRLEEAKLTGTVRTALRLNRLTSDGQVDVSSEEGVVTLRGEVGSAEAAEAAARVAGAVPDVKQVVSHLKVVASPPPGGRGAQSGGEPRRPCPRGRSTAGPLPAPGAPRLRHRGASLPPPGDPGRRGGERCRAAGGRPDRPRDRGGGRRQERPPARGLVLPRLARGGRSRCGCRPEGSPGQPERWRIWD